MIILWAQKKPEAPMKYYRSRTCVIVTLLTQIPQVLFENLFSLTFCSAEMFSLQMFIAHR